jgi:hypothetical protein
MWRQTIVQKWTFNGKFTAYLLNSDKSDNNKTLVATIVANVATERMGLDTTGLMNYQIDELLVRFNFCLLLHYLVNNIQCGYFKLFLPENS